MPYPKKSYPKKYPYRRRRSLPDTIPFNSCQSAITTESAGKLCANFGEPSFFLTDSLVVLDGGAFSQLGNAIQGMSRGLKFVGMRADVRLDTALHTQDNAAPVIVEYCYGLAVVSSVEGDSASRSPATLPNCFVTEDAAQNGSVIHRQFGRYLVPPANNGVAESYGSSDGIYCQFGTAGASQVGQSWVSANMRNSSSLRCRIRRNISETQMLLIFMQAIAYNIRQTEAEGFDPDLIQVPVRWQVRGTVSVRNWKA